MLNHFSFRAKIFQWIVLAGCWGVSDTKPATALIPFEYAPHILQGTNESLKDISPFWGMVAVHGKLLEHIRFLGFCKHQESEDKISKLLVELFPSPDGVQLVANSRDKDPVGELTREGNLIKINDIIEVLHTSKKKPLGHDEIERIGDLLPHKVSQEKREVFATLLVEAYNEEAKFADPTLPHLQRYPQHIVIISLLSFFVKVADRPEQIKDLSYLIKSTFNHHNPLEKRNYEQAIHDIKVIMEGNDLALKFFMGHGFDVYEKFISDPINYRTDTDYKPTKELSSGLLPDCGETAFKNVVMMLLSAKNGGIVASSALEGLEHKIQFPSHVSRDFFDQFKRYLIKHPSLPLSATKEAHSDWANVVSDLNKKAASSFDDVHYGRKTRTKNNKASPNYEVVEIKSNLNLTAPQGIFNMLNVIAKVIPDAELVKSWGHVSQLNNEAAEKLNRFCALFSAEGREVTWHNRATNSAEIRSPFGIIVFLVNGKEEFEWEFKDGHFQVRSIINAYNDWRVHYKSLGRDKLHNNWLEFIFRRLDRDLDKHLIQQIFEAQNDGFLSLIYNPSLGSAHDVKRSMDQILAFKKFQFIPLFQNWIDHSIPLDDFYFVLEVADYLAQKINSHGSGVLSQEVRQQLELILEKLLEKLFSQEGIFESGLFVTALEHHKFHIIPRLHFDRMRQESFEKTDSKGNTVLHLAIENEEFLKGFAFECVHPHIVNSQNHNGDTPLHIALRKKDIKMVSVLLEKGANPNIANQKGEIPFHLVLNLGQLDVIKLFVRNNPVKVDLESRDKDGRTPLHLIASMQDGNISTHIASLLFPQKVNVDVIDSEQRTPLFNASAVENRAMIEWL